MDSRRGYFCPVCGYTGLDEPARDKHGCASFQICPCCRTQFGYSDATKSHAELREKWVSEGMRWWSSVDSVPKDWNPAMQLARLKLFESKYVNMSMADVGREVHRKITSVFTDLYEINHAKADLNQWNFIESAINAGEEEVALETLFYLLHFEGLDASQSVLHTMASLVDDLYFVPPPEMKAWAMSVLDVPDL